MASFIITLMTEGRPLNSNDLLSLYALYTLIHSYIQVAFNSISYVPDSVVNVQDAKMYHTMTMQVH